MMACVAAASDLRTAGLSGGRAEPVVEGWLLGCWLPGGPESSGGEPVDVLRVFCCDWDVSD